MNKYILYPLMGVFALTANLAYAWPAQQASGMFINNSNESIYVVQLDSNENGGYVTITSPSNSCNLYSANESCELYAHENYNVTWHVHSTGGWNYKGFDCFGFVTNPDEANSSILPMGFFAPQYSSPYQECNQQVSGTLASTLQQYGQEIGFAFDWNSGSPDGIVFDKFTFDPSMTNIPGVDVVNNGPGEENPLSITFTTP